MNILRRVAFQKGVVVMPKVLTQIDETTRHPTMRELYEAARLNRIARAHERTFEQWRARVSDYGLADARQAYLNIRDSEHARLQQVVVDAAKSLRWAELFPAADWPIERERENFRRYVDALIAFEAEHKIGVER